MFKNIENLTRGSLIFVRKDYSPTSWFIRKLTAFKYSHVMLYLGVGKIIEADIGGVQINDFTNYLQNPAFFGEVVANPLNGEAVNVMIKATLKHLEEKYDYTLLFGGALTKIILQCNKHWFWRLIDHAKSWVCSELIAHGLIEGGFNKLKDDDISPRDLYFAIKRGS